MSAEMCHIKKGFICIKTHALLYINMGCGVLYDVELECNVLPC